MNIWQKIVLAGMLLIAGQAYAEDTVHYYYTDPQGTVLAKADAAGNVIATYDYAPYGSQALGTPPSGGPTGYTGHVNDPDTGLVYMQARYYDPERGGFLSVDPVGPSPGSLFHFNRYAYASNNPIKNIDPNGKDPMTEQAARALATSLNQKTTNSGSTGMYAVVHPESGPNGYTVQSSQQAAQEHAGLSSQASAEYGASSNAVSQSVCIIPAIAVALVVGDASDSQTSGGTNGLKNGVGIAGKALEIAKASPNKAVSAMAEGLAKPLPGVAVALAVPAAVSNQKACVSERTKDYMNRSRTAAQREQ